MITIVAGMQRSGSTFAFNIVRETLEITGSTFCIPIDNFNEALIQSAGYQHLIIKSHLPDKSMTEIILKGACKCICTYRNPIEAIQSWMSTFGFSFENSLDSILSWASWHQTVSTKTLNIGFPEVDHTPMLASLKIIKFLTGYYKPLTSLRLIKSYGKEKLAKDLKNLDRTSKSVADTGFSYYDKKTFLHRNHISRLNTNGKQLHLSLTEKNKIIKKFSEYNLTSYLSPSKI